MSRDTEETLVSIETLREHLVRLNAGFPCSNNMINEIHDKLYGGIPPQGGSSNIDPPASPGGMAELRDLICGASGAIGQLEENIRLLRNRLISDDAKPFDSGNRECNGIKP